MKITKFFKVLIVCCVFGSCHQENKVEEEVSKISVTIKMERFDQLFANVNAENLLGLKKQYSFLFPEKYPDSIWLQRAADTIQQEVNKEVGTIFSEVSVEEKGLHSLFQHIKYYFPEVEVPRIITITSDVDYQNKIILSNNLLIISLDTYLGKNHHFYDAIQSYIKDNFEREQILPDVATMYAKQFIELPEDRTFISNMIYYGKELYLKNLFLPRVSDASKMGYTNAEYDWVKANEEEIWRYFIDKQLLYSTERDLPSRFLYPAPFSKFYLEEIDTESPDRVGQYIGWKIVNSYMKNNNVSLQYLLMADGKTIFNASKYKPAR